MSSPVVIRAENISKQYRLGVIGRSSFFGDLANLWKGSSAKNKIHTQEIAAQQNADEFVWALKDINFEIKQGEVVGIIGKNGAGKSTLLKILSQITTPTKGSIKIKGRIASLLEVGTGFHKELTGRENIFLNGAILGMSKAEIRKNLDSIVDFSGVEKFIDTPVKRYSSGMYVRLAFAVAAHLDPEILIIDEVLAVGDAEFQKKCLGKMKDVASHGRTVLFVSHNVNAVLSLCTRGILLENGILVKDASVKEAVDAYLNVNDPASDLVKGYVSDSTVRNTRESADEIRVRRVYILNQLQAETVSLFFIEPFEICFDMVVKKNVENGYIRLTIFNEAGTRVCCITTIDNEIASLNFKEGESTVKVAIDPKLLPGKYFFEVTINSFDNKIIYENISNVLIFEVIQTSREENRQFRWALGNYYGFFRADARWDFPVGVEKTIRSNYLF